MARHAPQWGRKDRVQNQRTEDYLFSSLQEGTVHADSREESGKDQSDILEGFKDFRSFLTLWEEGHHILSEASASTAVTAGSIAQEVIQQTCMCFLCTALCGFMGHRDQPSTIAEMLVLRMMDLVIKRESRERASHG